MKEELLQSNYNDEIYAIEKFNSEIYVGTYNGLMKLNAKQQISPVEFNKNNYTGNHTFRINSLKSFNEMLFIGSSSGVFYTYKINGNHEIVKLDINLAVTSMTIDREQTLWIGTAGGKVFSISQQLTVTEQINISAIN